MIKSKTRVSAYATLIQHSTGISSHSNQTRKRNKRHLNWGRESRSNYLHMTDDEHRKPYRLHQKTTQPNKWIWQSSRYKVDIQKSKAFLYANNELSERETRKNIPFAIVIRKIKYLGINVTKAVKDLYLENYRTLKK